MKKFQHKPTIVEAAKWDGTPQTRQALSEWIDQGSQRIFKLVGDYEHPTVMTLNGEVALDLGDWIIKGERVDDFYPCKPIVFARTYDEIERDIDGED